MVAARHTLQAVYGETAGRGVSCSMGKPKGERSPPASKPILFDAVVAH